MVSGFSFCRTMSLDKLEHMAFFTASVEAIQCDEKYLDGNGDIN